MPLASVAISVNVELPVVMGVPSMRKVVPSVEVLSVNPRGNEPDVISNVIGAAGKGTVMLLE